MVKAVHPDRGPDYQPRCPGCGAFCGVRLVDMTSTAGRTELVACDNCGIGIEESEKSQGDD